MAIKNGTNARTRIGLFLSLVSRTAPEITSIGSPRCPRRETVIRIRCGLTRLKSRRWRLVVDIHNPGRLVYAARTAIAGRATVREANANNGDIEIDLTDAVSLCRPCPC